MKKNLIILVAALLCVVASVGNTSAQSFKRINFGAKVGVNVSDVSGLTDISSVSGADFTGGLFFELRPIRLIGVSIEGLYSAREFDLISEIAGVENRYDVGLNAIDVPIMAKLYILGGLSLNVGVMPSFLLPSKFQTSEGKDIDNDFSSVGVAIPIGISYQMGFGLLIDARYNFGLTDINSISEIGTMTHNITEHMKSKTFTFTLGWRFLSL